MRKVSLIAILLVSFISYSQERYKWYGNERQEYKVNELKKYIVFSDGIGKNELQKILGTSWEILSFNKENITNSIVQIGSAKYNNNSAIIQNSNKQNVLIKFKGLIYESTFLKDKNNEDVGISNIMYIEMDSSKDYSYLQEEIAKYDAVILGKDPLMPNWFIVAFKNNDDDLDVLDISNTFNKLRTFKNCAVSLLVGNYSNCFNDDFFSNQWGLENSGQNNGFAGIDIEYCDAALITQGTSNITVAVLDHGIDLNHPDLNNVLNGFNTETNSTPSVILGSHGTACAGIIGAKSNNNEGITGVASGCNLLSISNDLYGVTAGDEQRLALGLNWAWKNGADVISNSWGNDNLENPIIDNAIENALNFGRNGLGCVVVFATGNNDGGVGYPARSNARILAVGAIDRCGVRSGIIDRVPNSCDPWCSDCSPASQYGKELDVVAPGTSVYTTDISGSGGYVSGNYNPDFGGTSAACPYVAGVAALLLSINPCLTEKEVSYHIEKSAKTIRTDLYNYAFVDYPNNNEWDRLLKDWNQEVGYGLVNAESALLSVIYETFIKEMENEFISNNLSIYQMGTLKVGYDVNPYTQNGNYTVGSNSNVEFVATEKIILEYGFTASAGSVFSARIENFDGDCVVWSKQKEWEPSFAIEDELIEKIDSNDFNYLVKKAPLFFPNPFTNDLFVQYNLDDDSEVSIQIFSSLGQLIYSTKYYGNKGRNINKIAIQTDEKVLVAKI